jgi:hypothetical protein
LSGRAEGAVAQLETTALHKVVERRYDIGTQNVAKHHACRQTIGFTVAGVEELRTGSWPFAAEVKYKRLFLG